jgi:hypothetical protein
MRVASSSKPPVTWKYSPVAGTGPKPLSRNVAVHVCCSNWVNTMNGLCDYARALQIYPHSQHLYCLGPYGACTEQLNINKSPALHRPANKHLALMPSFSSEL